MQSLEIGPFKQWIAERKARWVTFRRHRLRLRQWVAEFFPFVDIQSPDLLLP